MRLLDRINDKKVLLLAELGQHLVKDVKDRITSADGGKWAPASKWIQAKKNSNRALVGVERYVKSKVSDNRLQIYAETTGYTLSQHQRGFTNKEYDKAEKAHDGRVEIFVQNPGPLGMKKPGIFRWVPKNLGVTPARKIWSDDADMARIGQPIFSRWLKNVIEGTEGVRK